MTDLPDDDDSSRPRMRLTLRQLNGTLTLEEVAQLTESIASHPVRDASRRWNSLQRSIGIVLANLAELVGYLERKESERSTTTATRAHHEVLFMMTLRLLMNYTSSTSSLVDHTRNLLRHYEGREFWVEYEAKKKSVIASPEVLLIGDLRNFMLHAHHPTLIRAARTSASEDVVAVLIHTEALRSSGRCAAAVRAYLEGKPTIRVLDAVQNHAATIEPLNRWLLEQFTELHGAGVGEYNDLIRQRDAAYHETDEIELDDSQPWSFAWNLPS